MISLQPANDRGLAHAQVAITQHHYLHAPVDVRCSPIAYEVCLHAHFGVYSVGWLIVGRPEATRCYDGALTYGSLKDRRDGRCHFDRWEMLNLARVWLHPNVQIGGIFYRPDLLPGYTDRRGVWRSTVASYVINLLTECVGYDYLIDHLPCFPDEPYEIKALLSYCDTSVHRGTIYRAAGWRLARINDRGIETYCTTNVTPLTSYQRDMIEKRVGQSFRSRRYRAQRAEQITQMELL